MHDTIRETEKQSAESLMTMESKTYYKMCKHHGNDEGCNADMDAMQDLLNQSSVLPIAVVQTTEDDDGVTIVPVVSLFSLRNNNSTMQTSQ